MKLNLFQVFYKDGQPLDSGCIPIDARGVDPVPLFENKHILDVSENLEGADYFGVTSWRLNEKTKLTKEEIDQFINDNPGYNAYLYGSYGNNISLVNKMVPSHSIGAAWTRLIELGLFTHDTVPSQEWINCFCNYWVADKATWDRYIVYLKKTIELMDSDPILEWMTGRLSIIHRGTEYPLNPFIIEYLFGLFLEDNPDIKYKVIPNLLTAFIPKMNKPFNRGALLKSLQEIYEYNKTPEGMGDKGTLHRYIQNYDKLFTDIRYSPITFLEIGVAEGYSLRMWRDYFAKARLIGIDIKKSSLETPGCEFYECDQSDKEQLTRLLKGETFDVIIDDGSHFFEHQVTSFEVMFPRLNSGGLYIIEDIQNPETEIPAFIEKFGQCEIYDTRAESGRYDDILLVWRKP